MNKISIRIIFYRHYILGIPAMSFSICVDLPYQRSNLVKVDGKKSEPFITKGFELNFLLHCLMKPNIEEDQNNISKTR